VILAVLSAPAAPSHTSPPAGTRSISASALSPPGRSRAETELKHKTAHFEVNRHSILLLNSKNESMR